MEVDIRNVGPFKPGPLSLFNQIKVLIFGTVVFVFATYIIIHVS